MVVAVLGACGAAGSTVLAAIETEWLNVNVNTQSTHPCTEPNTGNGPTTLDCINLIKLVSLFGFCSSVLTCCRYELDLSAGDCGRTERLGILLLHGHCRHCGFGSV